MPIVLAIRSCLILLNRDRMQSCAKLQTGGWYRYRSFVLRLESTVKYKQ